MSLRKVRPWSFSQLRESGMRGRADERAVRTRQRRSRQLLLESLEARVLLATDIRSFTDFSALDLSPPGELRIEIGGTSPGHSAGNANDGYDQIQVAGQATVSGTLQVALVNNYVPAVGTEYDFLTSGSVSGQFSDAKGLFSFPGGDRYFRVVQESDRLKLVVTAVPGLDIRFQPTTEQIRDGFGEFLNDYFHVTTFGYTGNLSVADFAHLSATVAIEKSGTTLKLGAKSVTAFVGSGFGTASEIGVKVQDAGFGLVIDTASATAKYALQVTEGKGGIVGVAGVDLTGPLAVAVNRWGSAVELSRHRWRSRPARPRRSRWTCPGRAVRCWKRPAISRSTCSASFRSPAAWACARATRSSSCRAGRR